MPQNTEVQARLLRAATRMTAKARIELNSQAQDRLGTLIAEATGRLEREGQLDDEGALGTAEEAVQTLIRAVVRGQLKGQREYRYESPQAPPLFVTEAALDQALRGICPLWPIC